MKYISKEAWRTIYILLAIGMIVGSLCTILTYHIINHYKVQQKPPIEVRIVKDTLCYNDSLILAHLKNEFKKREGFSPEEYPDDHGNWYIGYGHKTIPGIFIKSITEEQASDLLWKDEIDRYWIIRSMERKHLHDKLFQLFTTGIVYVR